ncbi:hypothetical protein [Kitasatospora sp. NPDC059327]|uniref:hypothetical protein n=1 Tax=Kitasatospora sp. NPDC059327 TaxID=3346803 RepID=UPI003693F633
MTPANEIKPGAVVEYHDGGHMLVATSDTVSNRWFGRRHFLHGVVLTLPAGGPGPWHLGGPADLVATPRANVTVHAQHDDPGRCPCTAHTRHRTH